MEPGGCNGRHPDPATACPTALNAPMTSAVATAARAPADVPAPAARPCCDADPGRPRLTWYGPDGERVELSAKVLDNWVAKTANLLVDELDAGPGSARRDRPAAALAHGGLAAGDLGDRGLRVAAWSGRGRRRRAPRRRPDDRSAPRRTGGPGGAARHCGRGRAAGSGHRVRAGLPPGALDAAAAVRTHGDVFLPLVRPAGGDPALIGADGVRIDHGELLARAAAAAAAAGYPPGVRLLTSAGPDRALGCWLAPLLEGGSLVLHHDLTGLEPAELERLAAQEAVTRRTPG